MALIAAVFVATAPVAVDAGAADTALFSWYLSSDLAAFEATVEAGAAAVAEVRGVSRAASFSCAAVGVRVEAVDAEAGCDGAGGAAAVEAAADEASCCCTAAAAARGKGRDSDRAGMAARMNGTGV